MNSKKFPIMLALSVLSLGMEAQELSAHFDMTVDSNGKITEAISKKQYSVTSQLPAFSVTSLKGEATRFDGYSNYVKASLASSTATVSPVAMLVAEDYTNSADETDAVAWFKTNYVDKGKGVLLTPSTISQLDATKQSACWVMCDLVGISVGYSNLPGNLASASTISALKAYGEAGGNLLLTNHATQLAVAVGRLSETYAPALFGSGSGGQNDDVWGSQPIIGNVDGQIYDHSGHAIYDGMNFTSGLYARSIYCFEGAGIKGDHNCMWDLNTYGLSASPNVVKNFEDITNSTVLGTWNHVVDYCCAGIVDFEPTTTYAGRILAVGLAAYEWNIEVTNPYLDQLELFTTNCINYLNPSLQALNSDALTLNVILAPETYPMMQTDAAEDTPTYATICGNLDETNKEGFALQLSSQGDLQFKFASAYANGYIYAINGTEKLPRGRWNMVTVVLDKANNVATLYLNGTSIGTKRMSRSSVVLSSGTFYIGKDGTDVKSDAFLLNTFCGLIDDISIYNSALTAAQVTSLLPSELATDTPSFNYPATRYASSLWRPQFHGMPSGGWTNESHGLVYENDKYHVFFQKNANGPYMSRLHWGHISSSNLYDWTEEPIALYPGESYDLKGCWSGCVFSDATITGGKTNILYTAVDNSKATIAQAAPNDNDLTSWTKASNNPIISGAPSGLSADFRDCYFFTANGNKYIIVGASKNNIGACTLHKYNNGSWTNAGTFFQGTNANQHGTFWEMPNITDMGNGKWLFTCTPLGLGSGVRVLYWVGTIGSDGTFTADNSQPKYLEMGGIGKEGYGLLSPSICKQDGKTILMGIVPDKLSASVNYQMGWAHNYSLPREISLSSDGTLLQKPYSGLDNMRMSTAYAKQLTLNGTESLSPVSGRQIELLGTFTVGSGNVGFNFLKEGNEQASLTYNSQENTLTLDLTSLKRQANDAGVYSGVYSATLPETLAVGETLKLHVYLDGSIADIFVNDKWAWSVRLFPTNQDAIDAEVFATAATAATVQAWTLSKDQQTTGVSGVNASVTADSVSFYDLQGRQLGGKPARGIYINNGKKRYAH